MVLSGPYRCGQYCRCGNGDFLGRPGVVFWMIVMGLLGEASVFIKSTLAQVYKQEAHEQYPAARLIILKKVRS